MAESDLFLIATKRTPDRREGAWFTVGGCFCYCHLPLRMSACWQAAGLGIRRDMAGQSRYVLSLSQHADELSVSVFDEEGRLMSLVDRVFDDLQPDELLSGAITLLDSALRHASIQPLDLVAVGVSASCYTVVIWDGISGNPVGVIQTPAKWTHWSMPERARFLLGEAARLGSGLDVPEANLRLGGVHTWLLWNLSQGRCFVLDEGHDLALMADPEDDQYPWDQLRECGMKPDMLPIIVKEPGEVTRLSPVYLDGARVPVTAISSVQISALLGAGIASSGKAFIHYGREGFLSLRTVRRVTTSLPGMSVRRARLGEYYEDQFVVVARFASPQAVLSWLQAAFVSPADLSDNPLLLMAEPPVLIAPWLGAEDAQAAILGIDAQTEPTKIQSAAFRALAFTVADLLDAAVELMHRPIDTLHVDRAGHGIPALFSFQAAVSSTTVIERERDSLARGTAILAGVGARVWTLQQALQRFEEHVTWQRYDIPDGGAMIKNQRERWRKVAEVYGRV